MRILRLGSSLDSQGETPPELRASSIAEQMLATACGEPIETILRLPRPVSTLAETVEAWVHEVEPDIVCFNISSFWCEGEVAAKRLRELGPIGRSIAHYMDRATKSYRFNANPAIRAGRTFGAYTIGGRPPFSPQQAASSIEAALRRIVRDEHRAVVVAGSPFSASLEGGAPARRRARGRRTELFQRLAEVCESLHIPYDLPAHAPDAFDKRLRTRDGLHFGPEMHARCGAIQGRLLVAAWEASRAETSASSG